MPSSHVPQPHSELDDTLVSLLSAIHQTVGRIEGRQDAFFEHFKQHLEDDKAAWAKVDTVLTTHESHKGSAKVIMGLFGLVSGALGAWVTKHFT